jgi:hypothetical protein
MNNLRTTRTLLTGLGLLLALSPASQNCWAVLVYFDGSTSSDFQLAANWTPENAPGTNLVDIYGIDDGFSSTYASGITTIFGLRVGSAAKEHASGEIHFGRLTMTGGQLEVIGNNTLVVGRENPIWYPKAGDYNKNTVVDAADYTVWRDTLGSDTLLDADGDENGKIEQADYTFWKTRFGNVVRGGELILSGSSTVKSYGLLVGERTKGTLSIGPDAAVDVRIWDTTVMPNQFGGTEDMRIGGYGPVFDIFGSEPGLAGDGLVDVQGTLTAKDLYVSEHGAIGELRVSGGTVNLNGRLLMNFCGGCGTDPALLALRSSKVTMVGSDGALNVGVDPDPLVVDPMPPLRDLLAASTTATFSFTADAGGVSPIVLADNGVEPSGTAYIGGSRLELNLDAYTSSNPLTLIDAPAGMVGMPPHPHLVGTFGSVTFLGSRTATVNYDPVNGDVFLSNFQIGSGSGALVGARVPEPSSLALIVMLGCFLLASGVGMGRNRARERGLQCLKIRK